MLPCSNAIGWVVDRLAVLESAAMETDKAGTVTMSLTCQQFGQPFNLRCDGWRHCAELQTMRFSCPWCGELDSKQTPGRIVSAKRRYLSPVGSPSVP